MPIAKIQFNLKDNEFKKLEKFVENLEDFGDKYTTDLNYLANMDANNIAEKLAEKYQGVRLDNEKTENSRNFMYTKLTKYGSKKNGTARYFGAPSLSVTKSGKNGFKITMNGKDILYHEFGTGLIGKRDKYPFNKMRAMGLTLPEWEYASGPMVLQGGHYKNASTNSKNIPEWYKEGLDDKTIKNGDAIWMSPVGPTQGNNAGGFLYDTITEYLEELQNEGISHSDMTVGLGKRSLYIMCKDHITKGL